MPRLIPVLTAFALVIVSGVGQGLLTDRWGVRAEPQELVARLIEIPMVIGEWHGQEQTMDPEEFSRAGIAGYAMRKYVNHRTGAEIHLLIVCGRPGPVSVHTPDVCFSGAGYYFVGEKKNYSLNTASNQSEDLWVADCVKERADPDQLRIFWSWTTDGYWKAPENPRLAFARQGTLFKLYVVRQLPKIGDPLETDPSVEFLRALLPEVERCLFAKS